mgnify:CR=1 FL=1
MAKPFEMYVFDWDGTLMDTTRLIMQGYRMLQRHSDFPVLRTNWYFRQSGSIVLIQSLYAAADCPKGRYAEFIQAYMDWYAKKEAQLELVPGFRKLLENMHKDGKRLAIATGKSREG